MLYSTFFGPARRERSIETLPEFVHLAPTATKLPEDATGKVIVCGSHGGAYAGYLVARSPAAAVILNDAAVGLDEAGIGSLALCDELGMPAATVAFNSARIGDAEDMYVRGRLSYVNQSAAALGCEAGMSTTDAAGRLRLATSHTPPAPVAEARHIVGETAAGLALACIDSVSLVAPEDAGQIVLSGSHGGIVSGQRALAIRVPAAAAFYNDAGVGMDDAGITRLPVLDEMNVAGVTVSAASARIGDGRSTYFDGVVSYCNALASSYGIEPGMPAQSAAELVKSR